MHSNGRLSVGSTCECKQTVKMASNNTNIWNYHHVNSSLPNYTSNQKKSSNQLHQPTNKIPHTSIQVANWNYQNKCRAFRILRKQISKPRFNQHHQLHTMISFYQLAMSMGSYWLQISRTHLVKAINQPSLNPAWPTSKLLRMGIIGLCKMV